jgi:hypothetical protein
MAPAISQAQHALAVEDLRREGAGEETRTALTREQLEELAYRTGRYAHTPDVHALPARAPAPPKKAPTRRYVY